MISGSRGLSCLPDRTVVARSAATACSMRAQPGPAIDQCCPIWMAYRSSDRGGPTQSARCAESESNLCSTVAV
jgi:hypothetical protein